MSGGIFAAGGVVLELESGFSSSVGQSRHAAVVPKRPAVETDLGDTRCLRPGSHLLPDRRRRRLVTSKPDTVAQVFVHRAGRDERTTGSVVDDLGVDVLAGTKHGEPRPLGRTTKVTADAISATLALAENRAGVVHG